MALPPAEGQQVEQQVFELNKRIIGLSPTTQRIYTGQAIRFSNDVKSVPRSEQVDHSSRLKSTEDDQPAVTQNTLRL
jgi:hypothetical protein